MMFIAHLGASLVSRDVASFFIPYVEKRQSADKIHQSRLTRLRLIASFINFSR